MAHTPQVVRERRVLLEAYLRCILTTKDARWRQAYGFLDFLAVPPQARASGSGSTQSSGSSGQGSSMLGAAGSDGFPPPPDHWTPQAWLAEQTVLSGMLRSVRSALLKRDALATMSDAAGSRSASVEAKRLLRDAESRIAGLERALGAAVGGLGEGEKRRREEMCENLKAERGNLQRMAEAGVRTSAAAVLSGSGGGAGHMPGGSGSLFAPAGSGPSFGGSGGTSPTVGRVFGVRQPPQETAETRPLDDRGLLQLQTSKMSDQDAQLGELSKVLRRQKDMGELIHREIEEQNDLLDEVESGVDRTGRKLGKAKREMNKLSK